MSKNVRLSHSAKEKYLISPRCYYNHYFLNLREKIIGSPLFFGSIIETGLDILLHNGTLEQAKVAFRKAFTEREINGQMENLSTSDNVRYNKKDFDPKLFTEKELKDLDGKTDKFKSWISLQRKGELLIETYSREIRPKIKKVLATQKYFNTQNDVGDEIVGFVDLVCEWEDGRIIAPDHKTSSQSLGQVKKNESYQKQFALYSEVLKEEYSIDAVGPIVLEKDIRVNEPKVRITYDFAPAEEVMIDKTFTEFDEMAHNIKQANFPCLAPKCNVYGQECCYKRYCESNGTDMTGLIRVDKPEKK